MQTALFGGLLICGSALLALLGVVLVRRWVPPERLAGHNDVASVVLSTTGITYAVVLGLVVVAVWEEFETARNAADTEANAVGDLFRLLDGLPEADRGLVRNDLLTYTTAVIEYEWPAMADDREASPRAAAALNALWADYTRLGTGSAQGSAAYEASLGGMMSLSDARQERLLEARRGLPWVLWAALIAGSIITVGFAFFFGVESVRAQSLMLVMLACSITVLLFLVFALNHPFSGDVRVDPEGFELVRQQFAPAATPPVAA